MRRILILAMAVGASLVAGEARGQTFRIRSQTLGEAQQFRRADLTVAAERRFTQSLSAWAYDAVPGLPGTVRAHLWLHYTNDFAFGAGGRLHPAIAQGQNRLFLDIGSLAWTVEEIGTLAVGRQWSASTVGRRDFDGVAFTKRPELGGDVQGRLHGWAGREVHSRLVTLDSDAFDVQGVPRDDVRVGDGTPWVTGVDLGIGWEEARLSAGWEKRFHRDDLALTGSERVGAGLHGNPVPWLMVGSSLVYDTVLQTPARASADVGVRAPWRGIVTVGFDHTQPIFDAASIFNVFGAQPNHAVHVTVQQEVPGAELEAELRGWVRAYHGDLDLSDLGGGQDDSRAYGGAAGVSKRFAMLGVPWTTRLFLSAQGSADYEQGAEQWLADWTIGAPAAGGRVRIEGRGLGFLIGPTLSTAKPATAGFTGVFRVVLPASFGAFSVSAEGTRQTLLGGSTNLWAAFEAEVWP